jgi:hypothetical protein
MTEVEEAVKRIDHMVNRWWDLSHKEGDLTDSEVEELRGWSIKVELFKSGIQMDGLNLKQYLALTKEEWGDSSQQKIQEELK